MEKDRLRRTLLGAHQVRRSKRQKQAFIDWVRAYADEIDIRMTVEESGKRIRSRNIVLGDIDHARTIITAHYDTCAWMPFGAGMTPGCWPIIVLIEIVQMIFLPVLLALMFLGASNPHTANDNTSGVLTVLRLAARLRERKDVAFVLFDNEEIGLLGSMAFAKAHPQAARRFLLNLDCVGDGDTWLLTGSKPALRMPQAAKIQKALDSGAPGAGMRAVCGPFPKWLYPSDQMLFPRGAAIAALKGRKLLYLDRIHTARDTVLDERNIRCLEEAIESGLTTGIHPVTTKE